MRQLPTIFPALTPPVAAAWLLAGCAIPPHPLSTQGWLADQTAASRTDRPFAIIASTPDDRVRTAVSFYRDADGWRAKLTSRRPGAAEFGAPMWTSSSDCPAVETSLTSLSNLGMMVPGISPVVNALWENEARRSPDRAYSVLRWSNTTGVTISNSTPASPMGVWLNGALTALAACWRP